MSRFTEVLLVSPLADGRTWVTRKEFGYDIGEEGSSNTIDVPIGFMTDFASVPRPLWAILPRWGKYGNAAVIHDYCYWDQSRSRKESDLIFHEAMQVLKVSACTVRIMYWAVRHFGYFAWLGNKQMKNISLSRLAEVMPIKSTDLPATLQAKK
ncbi:DUF1353 domain-containing protein [Chloroflexota bacterium]